MCGTVPPPPVCLHGMVLSQAQRKLYHYCYRSVTHFYAYFLAMQIKDKVFPVRN